MHIDSYGVKDWTVTDLIVESNNPRSVQLQWTLSTIDDDGDDDDDDDERRRRELMG